MRLGVLWHHFGPYHRARMEALAAIGDVHGIQMSGRDGFNAWSFDDRSPLGYPLTTIYENSDAHDAPPTDVIVRLNDTLDQINPDVLAVSAWATNYAVGGLEWGIRRRKPVVCMTVSTPWDFPRNAVKEFLKRQIVRNFSAAVAAGQAAADYVVQFGVPRHRVTIGYNSVDNSHFERISQHARENSLDLRSKLGLPRHYFVTVSRLIAKKNLVALLTAFREFLASRPKTDWKLVLVGEGPEEPKLQHWAVDQGISDRVVFAGKKNYAEIPQYLGLAEAFVLTSLSEQWGLVVNEAMACGLPVIISSRCGCARDLVDPGGNGLIINPEQPATIAEAMRTLHDDAALRSRMGTASSAKISGVTVAQYASRMWEAVQLATTAPRPSPGWLSRWMIRKMMARSFDYDPGSV